MKIVIIEDEAHTAGDLARTIKDLQPSIEDIPVVQSLEDAQFYLEQHPDLDLIFSDIQLGDGLSFELFENLKIEIPIVFCTAHDEYALNAFRAFGIDYILKPVSKEAVAEAFAKYFKLSNKRKADQTQDFAEIIRQLKHQIHPATLPSIILHQGEKMIPIESDKIAVFYIERDIVFATTFQSQKLATHYKLDVLERKFAPAFFRANRQILVNRRAVKEASQHFHRKLQVHLTIPFSSIILVGKERVTAFLEWLAGPDL